MFKLISPNESLFTYIYKIDGWGKRDGQKFFSGTGSVREAALPYTEFVSRYIKDHQIQSILDLGCGDFTVSRMIDRGEAAYLGVDVVKDLIAYNQRTFGTSHVNFEFMDIVHGDFKAADLCLIKQVFQHLSDADIKTILAKLNSFKHVLILDDYFDESLPPNVEVQVGGQRDNGTYLELPPFNCQVETLLVYPDQELGTNYRLIKLISAPNYR